MTPHVPRIPVETATEQTPAGEQMLVPGVRPVPVRERLDYLANQPLAPSKPQKPLDIGLFDEAYATS